MVNVNILTAKGWQWIFIFSWFFVKSSALPTSEQILYLQKILYLFLPTTELQDKICYLVQYLDWLIFTVRMKNREGRWEFVRLPRSNCIVMEDDTTKLTCGQLTVMVFLDNSLCCILSLIGAVWVPQKLTTGSKNSNQWVTSHTFWKLNVM